MEAAVRAIPDSVRTVGGREGRQVFTSLYCLGKEAEDMLTSTTIMAQSRKKYDKVLGKFDDFFKVRKNIFTSAPDLTKACSGKTRLQSSTSLRYTASQDT